MGKISGNFGVRSCFLPLLIQAQLKKQSLASLIH